MYCFLAFFPLDPGKGPSSFGKRKKRGFLFIPFSFTLSVLFFSFSSSFLLPLQTIQLDKWMPPPLFFFLFLPFPSLRVGKWLFWEAHYFSIKAVGFGCRWGTGVFLFFLLSIFHFLLFPKGKRRFFFPRDCNFLPGKLYTLAQKMCSEFFFGRILVAPVSSAI